MHRAGRTLSFEQSRWVASGQASSCPYGSLCIASWGQVVVAEQNLDDTDAGSALQKMGGKAVAQRKHRHPFVDAGRGVRVSQSSGQGFQ